MIELSPNLLCAASEPDKVFAVLVHVLLDLIHAITFRIEADKDAFYSLSCVCTCSALPDLTKHIDLCCCLLQMFAEKRGHPGYVVPTVISPICIHVDLGKPDLSW